MTLYISDDVIYAAASEDMVELKRMLAEHRTQAIVARWRHIKIWTSNRLFALGLCIPLFVILLPPISLAQPDYEELALLVGIVMFFFVFRLFETHPTINQRSKAMDLAEGSARDDYQLHSHAAAFIKRRLRDLKQVTTDSR